MSGVKERWKRSGRGGGICFLNRLTSFAVASRVPSLEKNVESIGGKRDGIAEAFPEGRGGDALMQKIPGGCFGPVMS